MVVFTTVFARASSQPVSQYSHIVRPLKNELSNPGMNCVFGSAPDAKTRRARRHHATAGAVTRIPFNSFGVYKEGLVTLPAPRAAHLACTALSPLRSF